MRGRRRLRSRAFTSRLWIVPLAGLGLITSSALWAAPGAGAFQADQHSVVSAVPAANTPDINDGVVFAIGQVGPKVILGGSFSSVRRAGSSTVYPLRYTMAFDPRTGAVDHTGFTPIVNGIVYTVIPGPARNEVYIGGAFTTVNGRKMTVALLKTTTGAVVSSWRPTPIAGEVNRLVLSHGRLYVGGYLSKVGGRGNHYHRDLVVVNPKTGRIRPYLRLTFTGHHSYGSKCNPAKAKCAPGRLGIKAFDVNPAGTKLVAVGNFTNISGSQRDQVALIDLRRSSAVVDPKWNTLAYTATCLEHSFDSDVRDVQFSPNGSYFVVVSAGGVGTNSDGTRSSCDAAARFATNGRGHNVRPTWIDYTGEDSLWSVAITGQAVYVGGHQRWMNNTFGHNAAEGGAIPRPGIAALSPQSGLPLSWNPGRDPRGNGAFALLATSTGLWMGSDTNYIGPGKYFRAKVAFFPLAHGTVVPPDPTPKAPGRIYLVGATASGAPDPDRLVYREFDGATAGAEEPLTTGIDWGSVDGAFEVAGNVIYGESDGPGSSGNLFERSFNGSTFGPEVELDPFNDPVWDTIKTGSGQTYQGKASSLAIQFPSITSMFFSAGRLFYSLKGQSKLHWRWFNPESGAVGADQFIVSDRLDWSTVAGAVLSGRTLYYADNATGELRSVRWTGLRTRGSSRLVNDTTDWASRGLFLLSGATNPTARPSAAFSGSCGHSATCTFTATPWVDPDGGVVKYSWNFGDRVVTPFSTSTSVSHRFVANGVHPVKLTVQVTSGTQASVRHSVTVAAPTEKIRFVGTTHARGAGAKVNVAVPGRAKAGDALLMFGSYSSSKARLGTPKGWRRIGLRRRKALTTVVYERVAGAHDAGRSVSLKFSKPVNSSLIVAAYRHTSSLPIEAVASRLGTTKRSNSAPVLRGLPPGGWVLGYWTQISNRPMTVRPPKGLVPRAVAESGGRPVDAGMLADTGTICEGRCRIGSARAQRHSLATIQWAVAIAAALK